MRGPIVIRVRLSEAGVGRQTPRDTLASTSLLACTHTLTHRHSSILERLATASGTRSNLWPVGLRQRKQGTQLRVLSLENQDALLEGGEVLCTAKTESTLDLARP